MVDLTLPQTAQTSLYSSQNHDGKLIAVYPLVTLTTQGTVQLRASLTTDPNTTDSLSIQSSQTLIDMPLRNLITHHLSISVTQNLHPTLFIAVVDTDFANHGVILVNLNIDLEGQVGSVHVPTSDALLYAVNLQIGNMDWEDIDSPLPSESTNDDDNDDKKPTLPILALYSIHDSGNTTTLHSLLDPTWPTKSNPSTWRTVTIGSFSGTSYDTETFSHGALEQVTFWHPWHCQRDENMDRHWVIVLDSEDPEKDGVVVVNMPWDEALLEKEDKEALLGCVDFEKTRRERKSVAEALGWVDGERVREKEAT